VGLAPLSCGRAFLLEKYDLYPLGASIAEIDASIEQWCRLALTPRFIERYSANPYEGEFLCRTACAAARPTLIGFSAHAPV
jgi:hypothetical protein